MNRLFIPHRESSSCDYLIFIDGKRRTFPTRLNAMEFIRSVCVERKMKNNNPICIKIEDHQELLLSRDTLAKISLSASSPRKMCALEIRLKSAPPYSK